MTDLAEPSTLFDRVPCLAGTPRTITPLPGGLTNRNYKVTTPDGAFVARVWAAGDLLAINRDHEHHNSVAAAAAGVGAPVLAYQPAEHVLVLGFLDGRTLRNADVADPAMLPRIAGACRLLHAGPRFAGDFDMFEVQRRYLAVATQHGFEVPDGYAALAPQMQAARRALAVRAGGTVPCNNDLLAANFIDDGEQHLADRLRVLRQQRPVLRAGQHRRRMPAAPGRPGRTGPALLRAAVAEQDRPGPAPRPGGQVRLDPVGGHPAGQQPDPVRLLGLGHGTFRVGGGRADQPASSPSCWTMWCAMTERFQVVIIGGGVIGTSVAYHLAELGCTDVLLLEQGQLSCGTTWHAAGLVGQLRASESGTRLVQYSTELYARLEAETGLSAGFRRCGGLIVARTADRLTQLRRTAAAADAFGLQAELLTPAQAGQRYPLMDTADLAGALWLPDDGKANPTDLTYALARGARDRGVTIRQRTRVTGILTAGGAVTGVRLAGRSPRRSRPRPSSTAPGSGPSRSAPGAG